MCLPDRFIDQASPVEMYRDAGLDAEGIVQRVCRTLGRDRTVIDLNAAR
jgi:1-deoxy-D-xylulose-5-phosphate synthase